MINIIDKRVGYGMVNLNLNKKENNLNPEHITKFKTALTATGKTTAEIAIDLNIQPSTLRNARCGYISPGLREKLAKYLGKTVKHLFGGYK